MPCSTALHEHSPPAASAHHGQAQRVAERVQHVFQADLPAFRVVGKHPGSLFHSTRIYKPTRSRVAQILIVRLSSYYYSTYVFVLSNSTWRIACPFRRARPPFAGWILALLAFAQLIYSLDINIVFVALPEIGAGLGFSGTDPAMGGQRLYGVLRRLPAAGRARRRPAFGQRRMFIGAVAVRVVVAGRRTGLGTRRSS